MNHTLPILVYLFIALIVTQIPYLRVYFSLGNTLLYEVIRVMLEGGVKKKINLHNEGSGRIINIENSRFKHILITYLAYTGASLAAIGLFYLVSNQNYYFIIYLFIALMVVAVLLWIRHFWGIIWVLSFVVLLALPMYLGQTIAIMHISIFLSSFLLIQSIMNGIQVCRQSLLERKKTAGSSMLARLKFIPAMMLGVVLLGQSLYTGYFIAIHILSLH